MSCWNHKSLAAIISTVTILLAALCQCNSARAATFPTLLFAESGSNGSDPGTGLVQDADGSLYGECFYGGSSNNGTVYKIDSQGNYSVIHNFGGSPGDGSHPLAAELTIGMDGYLYGATGTGGGSNAGVVFQLSTDGSQYKILHDFTGIDGALGCGGVTQTKDGYLIGSCQTGGVFGYGSIYKLNTSGTYFKIIYSFTNGADSSRPIDPPIQGKDGKLYGDCSGYGFGTDGAVFSLSETGKNFTIIHTFAGGSDGCEPGQGRLAIDPQGRIYGTCASGGANGDGLIFSIAAGAYSPLCSFAASEQVGSGQTLVYSDGYLYGAAGSAANGFGSIFRVSANGSGFEVLYNFTDGFAGKNPSTGNLLVGNDGMLYGTLMNDGPLGGGTIYEFAK